MAAAVVSLAGCSGEQIHASVPRHLVLVTFDTLRADHFDAEIGGEPLTPALASFAERAIRFEQATSVGAATSPGIAAILTGLLPARSGVLGNRHMLPEEVPTLATILADHGFRTAAFVANPVLGARYGFARGFAEYQVAAPGGGQRKARAGAVVARALTWLDEQPADGRVFLWLHLFEPHGPYEPPDSVLARFPAELFGEPRHAPLLGPGKQSGWGGVPFYQQQTPNPYSDAREYQRRYASEIRALDDEVAQLLAALDQRGFIGSSAIAFTADHGEALVDDHGFFFSHENGLTQDQIAVPLVVRIPGHPAAVLDRPVSTVDLFPTLLRMLDLEPAVEHDGNDLLLGEGGIVFSQSAHEMSVRHGWLKLRRNLPTGAQSLHDLAADPWESIDLAGVRTDDVRKLTGLLDAAARKAPLARAAKRQQRRDDLEAARLRALGYW